MVLGFSLVILARLWGIFPCLFCILCIDILLSLMTEYWLMRRKDLKIALLVLRLGNLVFCWMLSGSVLAILFLY